MIKIVNNIDKGSITHLINLNEIMVYNMITDDRILLSLCFTIFTGNLKNIKPLNLSATKSFSFCYFFGINTQ